MIDVTSAVETAKNYFESVFLDSHYRNIRLEEAELGEDDRYWLITFSFDEGTLGGTLFKKNYKTVKIDASSGQARGVKIRVLA